MEGEEKNKVGSKKRRKQIDVGFDSGDDEPIGSFLKLKSKRNPKKNKLGSDGSSDKGKGVAKLVVQDDDLIGMDDTLASFRKKLRAPKRDGGRVSVIGNDFSSSGAELFDQSLNEPAEDNDLAIKVAEQVLVDGDVYNGTADKGLEEVARKTARRSRVSLALKTSADHAFEPDDLKDHRGSGENSSQQEKKGSLGSSEGSLYCFDEGLEDSLSNFFQKAQSGLIRKSRNSLRLKPGKENQVSADESDQITNDVSEDNLLESARKSQTVLKLANDVAESDEDFYAPDRGLVDSTAICDKTDDIWQAKCSNSNSSQDLCSAPLITLKTSKPENVVDASSEGIPGNSVLIAASQRSQSCSRACFDAITTIQDDGFTYQTSLSGSHGHHAMETASVSLNVEMPVSLTTSEVLENQNFNQVVYARVSNSDLKLQSNATFSNDDALKSGKKICTSAGKEVAQFRRDHEPSCRQCEDNSPVSTRKICCESLEPSASPIEESTALREEMVVAGNSHSGLDSERSVQHSGPVEVPLLSAFHAPQKELSSNYCNGPDQLPNCCTEEADMASISSGKEDAQVLEDSLSPVSECGINKYEVSVQVKCRDKSLGHGDDFNPFSESPNPNEPVTVIHKCNSTHKRNEPFDGSLKDACLSSFDCLSGDDEVKDASSPSDVPEYKESLADETGLLADRENHTNWLSVGQRAPRNPKKHRHGDMAYEGDADWEILIHEQDFLVGRQVGDGDQSSRTREKFNVSLSNISEAVNRGASAISAGLKARAAGPVEKIKFKEVLKRKGGLQEYLECRNFILSLWNKDVSRILPLSDCGVPNIPVENESPRAALVRDIYAFLDQCGYINFGVASEKAENSAAHNLKLLKDENFVGKSGSAVTDAHDGVSFILGGAKNPENSSIEKHDIKLLDERKEEAREKLNERLVDAQAAESSTQTGPKRLPADHHEDNDFSDAKLPDKIVGLNNLSSNHSSEHESGMMLPLANSNLIPPCEVDIDKAASAGFSELPKGSCNLQSSSFGDLSHSITGGSDGGKRIIVVGAGPAGLTAARHLRRQGFYVTVLEARSRIGGRVFTDRSSLSVPVDLGASIITGVEADVATERRADPSSLVCAQLGLELTVLNSDCPLYDIVTGQKVPPELDEALEAEYNSLLDDMIPLIGQRGGHAMQMSLEDGLEYALKRRRMACCGRNLVKSELHKSLEPVGSEKFSFDGEVAEEESFKEENLSPLERRVMDWHFANLEYGCAALLKEVSLPHWNQDDVYGGFGGAHCMIKGGYSSVVESLGEGLCIHLNHVVTEIMFCLKDDTSKDGQCKQVKVSTSNGKEFLGDAVLITVPLGCLKAEAIKFSPPLPQWKNLSIQRLGFGVLNKVVMEFAEVFWDDTIDYFGATAEETSQRGWCFMFWNVKKTVGAPVLIALVVGRAAIDGQNLSSADHVNHALVVLRKLFGETAVPDPVASVVTDWGRDPYSYGAYSYVAVGSSGEDYDLLGRPVENCLFFAGEATCKEHPDTVGGAMMSGLREAVRIIDILNTGTDYTAEVEVLEATKRRSDVERSEIRDIIKRLDTIEVSNVLYKKTLDQTQLLTRESLLQDMFYNAKTTAGRLHVAKELLKLPVQVLKSFAGGKKGLSVLNSWMLDSMGKDGTQLLRHCVRLLVLVSTDLLAVRLSGIGKTVKEKVCVHTSRDIRAIASQLVSVWIEIFRKEKASNGGLKLLRQSSTVDPSRGKSLQAQGRPPLGTNHIAADNRGTPKVSSSKNHLPSSGNVKKAGVLKTPKLDARIDSKLEVKPSSSQGSGGRRNAMEEENEENCMTEEEKAAFAAAEAARAAAHAAAEAYASSGTKSSTSLQLPKIPSFHKFARREQYARMDESDIRKNWSAGAFGKQDCLSEIDSRNCRVRDWSVDFSAAGVNIDASMSVDNISQRSHSNEIACQLNFREHSGESVAVDSSLFTKAWVDTAGSEGIKDYNAIERWQCQAAAANSDFFNQARHIKDEEDSNTSSQLPTWKHDARANESSASQVTVNKGLVVNQTRGPEHIKQAVVDYVASLLMPLYKARKIDKDGYKSIMKKTATKVMEMTNDAEKAMAVSEFLDFKRKNKIRAFVDKLIERHMAMKPAGKS